MRKPKHCFGIIAGIAGLTFSTLLPAQGPGRPGGPPGGPGGRPLRQHTATEAKPLDLVPATEKASGENQVAIQESRFSREGAEIELALEGG